MERDDLRRLRKAVIHTILAASFLLSVLILSLHYALGQGPSQAQYAAGTVEILNARAAWRYMEEGKDPSVGKVWTTLNYDASFWKTGCGSFSTSTDSGADNLLENSNGALGDIYSYFFRYEFDVEEEQAARLQSMTGELSYKDAVVVYLNGEVLFTGNIPPGGFETNLEAGASEEKDGVTTSRFQASDLSALQSGKNVLSVEIHQSNEKGSDIYFAFSALTLSEERVQERSLNTRYLLLTKSEREDSVVVNYVSGQEASCKVEYMESADYTGVDSLEQYGETVYMGSQSTAGGCLHKAELTHLKENMDYVYRISRVGERASTRIYRFSTGKNYRTSFGITALPDGAEWRESLKHLQGGGESVSFFALIGGSRPEEDALLSELPLWQQKPGIYIGTDRSEAGSVLDAVFGAENFYCIDQDITVVGIRDDAGAAEYIRRVKRTTKREWIVALAPDCQSAGGLLDAGANLVFSRTEEGALLISGRENGETLSRGAGYAEVIGYENRLELKCLSGEGAVTAQLTLR